MGFHHSPELARRLQRRMRDGGRAPDHRTQALKPRNESAGHGKPHLHSPVTTGWPAQAAGCGGQQPRQHDDAGLQEPAHDVPGVSGEARDGGRPVGRQGFDGAGLRHAAEHRPRPDHLDQQPARHRPSRQRLHGGRNPRRPALHPVRPSPAGPRPPDRRCRRPSGSGRAGPPDDGAAERRSRSPSRRTARFPPNRARSARSSWSSSSGSSS